MLCVLLGNLLDNALEACRRQKEGEKRFLRLRGRVEEEQFLLAADNSCAWRARRLGERFYSDKREGFGMGTRSIRAIVEEQGGLVQFEPQDNVFRISILIPLRS